MVNNNKKLSIAFYWHMHQPVYQLSKNSDYLMPWVRLHAIKDYLDMVLILDKFQKLKLNINLAPVLVDALIDYSQKGYHDVYSRLSVSEIKDLTEDDKIFILNNFFDANYESMIFRHKRYHELYQKRISFENPSIESFSDQEFEDIMAWFNLTWFDRVYKDIYPRLTELVDKQSGYTLQDRIEIIALQKEIIKQIIPTYKRLAQEGRIEITTSPYYHPILPILLDIRCAYRNVPNPEALPSNLKMATDAKIQMERALDRIEEVFGIRPKGIWPPELCISAKTLDMLKDLGVEWTISDEGILANSINVDFVRNFKGHLNDPYFLLKTYQYKAKDSDINVVFRESSIPSLINYEYPTVEAQKSSSDLYDRIKTIQSKILTSPDETHLLTIASNGENCWESYKDDGEEFLNKIYGMIEEDDSLETVLISEYLEKDKNKKQLHKIYSGSWINRNFQMWIGEPIKNMAWNYLQKVHNDFVDFVARHPNHEKLEDARKELFIAQGSDWFWWYGEPNHSAQDSLFDYLFREHLKNVYRYFDLEIPYYLNISLFLSSQKQSQVPTEIITPIMDGQDKIDDEWLNAGVITIPNSPFSNEQNLLFDKIRFGFDMHNLYLRMYLNEEVKENNTNKVHQMFIYMRNLEKQQNLAPVRLVNRSQNVFPIIQENFHNELMVSFVSNMLRQLQFTKSSQNGLWFEKDSSEIKVAYDNVIDISIPFNVIDVNYGETLEFMFMSADFGVLESFAPQEVLLTIQRPKLQQ